MFWRSTARTRLNLRTDDNRLPEGLSDASAPFRRGPDRLCKFRLGSSRRSLLLHDSPLHAACSAGREPLPAVPLRLTAHWRGAFEVTGHGMWPRRMCCADRRSFVSCSNVRSCACIRAPSTAHISVRYGVRSGRVGQNNGQNGLGRRSLESLGRRHGRCWALTLSRRLTRTEIQQRTCSGD